MFDDNKLTAARLWVISAGRSGTRSPDGPRNQPYLARALYALIPTPSDDVLRMTVDEGWRLYMNPEWLAAASVPDGVRAPDGRVLVYYVNGAQHGVWVGVASATGWSPLGPITIDGVPDPLGIVDPDAYRVGGRIRLAYLANFTSPSERAICLAESEDGVSFRTLGLAVDLRTAGTVTDPSVVQLPNGSWLMALSSGQTTRLARSADGLTFTLGESLTYGGVPELALTDDGAVRLYVCAGAIVAYRSPDAATWQREQAVVTRGPNGSMLVCDPSRVAGTDLFVFKTGT